MTISDALDQAYKEIGIRRALLTRAGFEMELDRRWRSILAATGSPVPLAARSDEKPTLLRPVEPNFMSPQQGVPSCGSGKAA